jgi:hypothetical protein
MRLNHIQTTSAVALGTLAMLFAMAFLLSSCQMADNRVTVAAAYGISTYTIDGCEYVVLKEDHGACIIHKANCKNTFHETH